MQSRAFIELRCSITSRTAILRPLFLAILLAAPNFAHAATPELLLDVPANLWNINFVTDRDYSNGQSLPWMPIVVQDGTHGFELWRTDGTPAGTQLIKDIWPGASSGIFQGPFVPFDDLYVFPALNGSTSCREVWRTDGTEAGTISLATDCTFNQFNYIEVCNGVAFFIGKQGSTLGRLWRTDGTVAGTYKVSETVNAVGPMRCLQGELLFLRREAGFPGQIWKTDGTEAGMQVVADIDASRSDDFQVPVALDASVIFKAVDDALGREPWRTDGTTSGTYLLNDIWPGISSGTLEFSSIERWQNSVFFEAQSPQAGNELWKTDGTPQGTTIVRDLTPASNVSTNPSRFTPTSSFLFFKCTVASEGEGWCRTDGTTEGTQFAFPLSHSTIDGYAIGIGENIYYYGSFTIASSDGTTITELANSVVDGHYLAFVNSRLLFATREVGREKMWALQLSVPPPVPAVSTWGLTVLFLGVGVAGTCVLRRPRVA